MTIRWSLLLIGLLVGRAKAAATDPFADVSASSAPAAEAEGAWRRLFGDNFGFRKELMSEFATSENAPAYSRQSAGFEVLKKFSTETATVASLDFQGRLVRRDRYVPVQNDLEGANRPGWWFEYHNAYADLYNVAGPVGRFNVRAGRFYVPFGLNLQTDTHGTLLQLSNERNFGFERDWYAGLWGDLNDSLNYDAYYLVGSGYDLKYRGQSGLGAARLSLSNRFSAEHGLEGGLSLIGGQRLDPEAAARSPAVAARAGPSTRVETERLGADGRYRLPVPNGVVTWTSELSGGRDAPEAVFTQLHQVGYLHSSRRWGMDAQYRRFWQDGIGTDGSIIGEATWYFRNDVGNSNLHWIKINVERKLESIQQRKAAIVALQYYRYW